MWRSGFRLPPYRTYRIRAKAKPDAVLMDLALYREKSSHDHIWVVLKGCEIRGLVQALSPRAWHPDRRDAPGPLSRHQGRPIVLVYED